MNRQKKEKLIENSIKCRNWTPPDWAFRPTPGKGIRCVRLNQNNPREVAFAQEWDKENDSEWNSGTNHGRGILQDLFINTEPNWPFFHKYYQLFISRRERMIVATVIQWLGSNCGMSFLHSTLGKCGYKIVPIRDDNETT